MSPLKLLLASIICMAIGLPTALLAAEPSFTSGLGKTVTPSLLDCGKGSRVSAVGKIKAEDGTEWTVPAATNYTTAPHAFDLYNECAGVTRSNSGSLDLETVPVLDAGGDEVFTTYLFADNYFELYVNGKLLAVDPVPFTPFNSNVVRFKADRPLTIAIQGVDWEENLGLGSERGRGSAFSPGDAGVVGQVLDSGGNVLALTDDSWRAETFYISPIADRNCLQLENGRRDSSTCSVKGANSADGISAAHWPLPEGWEQPGFDDSAWPQAVTFTNDTVGVNNKPGYTNFTDIFDAPSTDAQFIWSSNLVLDNLVLLRKTIE